MTIYDEIKKTKARLEQLEAKLELETQESKYGRLALKSDEANFSAGTYGEIIDIDSFGFFYDGMMQGRTFTTKAAAERFLKAERLAFKCRQAMAKSWGDTPIDWSNEGQPKFAIFLSFPEKIGIYNCFSGYERFIFKTETDAFSFRTLHKKEDIVLMLKGGDV